MTKLILSSVVGMALAMGASGCGRGADRLERASQQISWKVADAMEDLDATPQQTERAQALAQGLVADAKPVVKQGLEAREALVDEWKSARPDAAKVHALVDAQVDAVRGLVHRAADAAIELHGLLTPAQRDEVTQRLERHAKR
ncbi:MAG: Spy/CpxP family protein refolding chaperone [Myxococcota bacterium]|jgi:Spy/CpxP family protein refolding chaperone